MTIKDNKLKEGIIYCVTNIINKKKYIGQTTQPLARRLKDHFSPSKKDKGLLSRSAFKYGKENFETTILERVDISLLNEKEKYYIEKMNTKVPNGYNLADGGDNFFHNEITKRKISESLKGKKQKKRQPLSEIHKQNISKANTNKKRSKISIQRMKDSRKNKKKISDNHGRVYESIQEAGRILGIRASAIHAYLVGKRKSINGLTFIEIKDSLC